MQEREAQILIASGDAQSLTVSFDQNSNGWIVYLHLKHEPEPKALVTKREKESRKFRTSDAALRWCKRMGINEVNVVL
jgi:hypothetical protein